MPRKDQLYSLTETKHNALIVSLELPNMPTDTVAYLEETSLLLSNLGIKTVAVATQKRQYPDPACFIGSGKAVELKKYASEMGATLLVVDDFLTTTQKSNLQKIVKMEVWDRAFVIMQIFASRAHTAEAKLQVELAQYHYEIPSLKGLGYQMSRTGGGIGTRGPGETEFERHRRKLDKRIKTIKRKLFEVRKRRSERRERRRRNGVPIVSLVGYTNSGKSTLLSALSKDDAIYTKNQLFSTLDTLVRKVEYRNGPGAFLLSDTVGFIRKLPAALVEAFRATLEEVSNADLLLVVIDVSDRKAIETYTVVIDTLKEINADKIPKIVVLNKIDKVDDEKDYIAIELRSKGETVVFTSALEKIGFDELLLTIHNKLLLNEPSYEYKIDTGKEY